MASYSVPSSQLQWEPSVLVERDLVPTGIVGGGHDARQTSLRSSLVLGTRAPTSNQTLVNQYMDGCNLNKKKQRTVPVFDILVR